jgi:hypothetical protein
MHPTNQRFSSDKTSLERQRTLAVGLLVEERLDVHDLALEHGRFRPGAD